MILPASFLAWLKKASDRHVVWLVFSQPRGFPSRKGIHLDVQKAGYLRGLSSFVARCMMPCKPMLKLASPRMCIFLLNPITIPV
jgi:hypothetical protein